MTGKRIEVTGRTENGTNKLIQDGHSESTAFNGGDKYEPSL